MMGMGSAMMKDENPLFESGIHLLRGPEAIEEAFPRVAGEAFPRRASGECLRRSRKGSPLLLPSTSGSATHQIYICARLFC